jgi:general secretion pathway protein I
MTVDRLWMTADGRVDVVVGAAGVPQWRFRHVASAARRMLRQLRGLMNHRGHEAGFTLVEVIVALAMLSIGLTILLGLFSSSLWQSANAEKMAEAGSLAQSLMAEVGADLPIKSEERAGQYPSGYRWHLKMEPYGDAREREEWPVGVYMVSAEVEWGEGTQRRSYALTTLRLGPRQVRQ